MNYTVEKKCVTTFEKDGHEMYRYKLRCNGEFLVSGHNEKEIMDIFKEFCNAKAAGTLYDYDILTVKRTGKYILTKGYGLTSEAFYKVFKKSWFPFVRDSICYKFYDRKTNDEEMIGVFDKIVLNGGKYNPANDTQIIASC